MSNASQELPASSKAPNQDLKDMDVLCTFKIKIESQNLEHGCTKDQLPYTDEDLVTKSQSGTSSPHQRPKSGLKEWMFFDLQNQDREPKFGTGAYQRPVTISISRSRCQTPVRNLQHPPKTQMRTKRMLMFLAHSKSK